MSDTEPVTKPAEPAAEPPKPAVISAKMSLAPMERAYLNEFLDTLHGGPGDALIHAFWKTKMTFLRSDGGVVVDDGDKEIESTVQEFVWLYNMYFGTTSHPLRLSITLNSIREKLIAVAKQFQHGVVPSNGKSEASASEAS